MNSHEFTAHMNRFDRLREVLAEVQDERQYRPVSNGSDGWIVYEQLHMWGVVNRMRAILMGKQPIPFEDIQRVESLASGHVDYSKKFALYCAELLLKD